MAQRLKPCIISIFKLCQLKMFDNAKECCKDYKNQDEKI